MCNSKIQISIRQSNPNEIVKLKKNVLEEGRMEGGKKGGKGGEKGGEKMERRDRYSYSYMFEHLTFLKASSWSKAI